MGGGPAGNLLATKKEMQTRRNQGETAKDQLPGLSGQGTAPAPEAARWSSTELEVNNKPEADNSDPELPGESGHSVYRGLGLHACESSAGGKDLDVVSLGGNPRRQHRETEGGDTNTRLFCGRCCCPRGSVP